MAIQAASATLMSAMNESHTMMMALRLSLSATTPPNGESSPMGRNARTYKKAMLRGEPVVSVAYQMPE